QARLANRRPFQYPGPDTRDATEALIPDRKRSRAALTRLALAGFASLSRRDGRGTGSPPPLRGRVREGGRTPHLLALPLLAGLILAACAPGTPRAQLGDGIQQGSGQPQPTLAIVLRVEPVGMTDSASSLNRISLALFSAYLAQKD